ncbi:unnamed protein product [Brassica rapa subsp. narinosa]
MNLLVGSSSVIHGVVSPRWFRQSGKAVSARSPLFFIFASQTSRRCSSN